METRANFVLIGSFTLAVIAAAFGFVLWFQSLHTTKARSPLRIVFEGPASGLRNGGSVNFNGIRIGEVISVKLDNPRRVVAGAQFRKDRQRHAESRRRDGEGRPPHARPEYAGRRQGGRRVVPGGEIDPRTGGRFRQAIGRLDGGRPPDAG